MTVTFESGNTPCNISYKKVQRKTYLAEIGVQIADTVAEFFYVLREKLIGVGYSVIEVAHLVVSESSQIFLVQMVTKTSAES